MLKFFAAALVALVLSVYPALAEKRVALVIGVGAYTIQSPLRSSANDARVMARALKQRGFTLVGDGFYADVGKVQFDDLIEQFGEMAADADVAVFYYSGHGMQVNGVNYLFPVDSPLVNQYNLANKFINANIIMSQMSNSGSRLKIILLDACRSNPFAQSGKSDAFSPGFAQMNAPAGTIIGFATQPGSTASDGPSSSANSPYTAAMYTAMIQPGYDQFRVFNEAALTVMHNSNGRQQPWISASPISAPFYFTPPLANVATSSAVNNSMAAIMPAPAPLPAVVTNTSLSQGGNGSISLNAIQEADKLFSTMDYEGGRKVLTEAITNGQRTAIAYSYRGYASLQDGLNNSNPHESLALYRSGFNDFDVAISLEPTYPNSYRHRGNTIMATWKALKKTNQRVNNILDNAVADLQNAVKLDPTSMKSAYFLGEAYNLKGDYASAMYWFNKALELNPKFVAPHAGLCYAKRMSNDMIGASQEADYAARRDSDQADKSCLTQVAWARYVPKF